MLKVTALQVIIINNAITLYAFFYLNHLIMYDEDGIDVMF